MRKFLKTLGKNIDDLTLTISVLKRGKYKKQLSGPKLWENFIFSSKKKLISLYVF